MPVTMSSAGVRNSPGSEDRIVFDIPTTVANGDRLFVEASLQTDTGVGLTINSGWTTVVNGVQQGNVKHFVWTRVWKSGDTRTVTVTKPGFLFVPLSWAVVSGGTETYTATSAGADGTSVAVTGVTANAGEGLVVLTAQRSAWTPDGTGAATLTAPSGFASSATGGLQDGNTLIGFKVATVAGSQGTITTTANKSTSLRSTVIVVPALAPQQPLGVPIRVYKQSGGTGVVIPKIRNEQGDWVTAPLRIHNGTEWTSVTGNGGNNSGGGGTPPPPSPTGGAWLSGASYPAVADGRFATWRGTPTPIVGTWQLNQTPVILNPGEELGSWNQNSGGCTGNVGGWMDIAIGAITGSESWAQAGAGASGIMNRHSSQVSAIKVWADRNGVPYSKVIIRYAHELNGDWYDWRLTPANVSNFASAWSRFWDIAQSIMPGVKCVPCFNADTSNGMAKSRTIMQALDMNKVSGIGVDFYNFYPHETSRTAILAKINKWNPNDPTDPYGPETFRQVAAQYGKWLIVSEWGNSSPFAANEGGGGGESPVFIEEMHNWFKRWGGTGPGNVFGEIYFNAWNRYKIYSDGESGVTVHQPITAAKYVEKF